MQQNIDDATMDRIKASLLDCYRDFISIANVNRDIIYFNPAAYRMMGYEEHERPNILRTEELHTPEADEIARTQIQPAVFRDGYWRGISYIRHKDGSPITVEMTVFPIYGQHGEEYGTVAIMRDVDELSKVNDQLRKSMDMFQKVMDSARIGIVLINMDNHTIEMSNEYTKELLGLDDTPLVGQKCYDVLCHRPLDMCPHMHQTDKFLLFERCIERPDGTSVPIIKTGTRIQIGATPYLVDTFVDISMQKALEKNLQEAMLAAEAANSSKSEFLSRMSHEMRTPLNAIIGMTQISEKVTEVDKLKGCIDTIKLSSKHLLGLINDILDLSKIEEGKLELSPETFTIAEMIQKIAMLISPKAQEKHIDFVTQIDPDIPPYLSGDALRISQVLLNFLSNAVKFTPERGSIRLDVQCTSRDAKEAVLHFAVCDSGIGITPEQLDRLFSPFTQADGSISRKFGGTGLGLVISKRLSNLMQSDVEVTSTFGEGSTFAFDLTLPVSDEDDYVSQAEEGTVSIESVKKLFTGKRLLVADDVEVNRMIVDELLSGSGIVFDEATDGSQALEKASQTLYDIILMDIQMPVMDGYEATKQIRALPPPHGQVPIVAMSANVFKEDVRRSLATGMNAHIGKPVNINEMLTVMSGLLRGGQGKPEPTEKAKKVRHFRSGITAADYDAGQFDFAQALENQGGDIATLEVKCNEFLRGMAYFALNGAMATNNYPAALEALDSFIALSGSLAMGAVTAFARNISECVQQKTYQYARMYLLDLTQWYPKVCAMLSDLLE